jgi:hypothetical protein
MNDLEPLHILEIDDETELPGTHGLLGAIEDSRFVLSIWGGASPSGSHTASPGAVMKQKAPFK